nr:HIT domain-containing protein [Candidatus Njordarchaeota archaeon]
MGGCAFCDPEISFKQGNIDRVLYGDDDLYVAIPREPAMRGHLLVVSKKHIEDIASVTEKDWTVLLKMMIVSSVVSKLLMKIDESIKKV